MNIAIEVNGSYYHNKCLKDIEKYKLCNKLGVQLIMFYDYEWYSNNAQIKQYLTELLQNGSSTYGTEIIGKTIKCNNRFQKLNLEVLSVEEPKLIKYKNNENYDFGYTIYKLTN